MKAKLRRTRTITLLLRVGLVLSFWVSVVHTPAQAVASKKAAGNKPQKAKPKVTVPGVSSKPAPSAPSAPSTSTSTSTLSTGKSSITALSEACPSGAARTTQCFKVPVPLDHNQPAGPKMDLIVTLVKATNVRPGVTSPVLNLNGEFHQINLAFAPPLALAEHDVVYVDRRGNGRSGTIITPCPGTSVYGPELNTGRIDSTLGELLSMCSKTAALTPTPTATVIDSEVDAMDLVIVRRALGIDSWAVNAYGGAADIALRLMKLDPNTVTSLLVATPYVVGKGQSIATVQAAFSRVAADCAASTTCSKRGDLNALLLKAIERTRTGIATKTPAGAGGGVVTIDAATVVNSVQAALRDPSLLPKLPDLLVGLATGAADETVAGLLAQYPNVPFAVDLSLACQNLSYQRIALPDSGKEVPSNPFGLISASRLCSFVGPVPQLTAAPLIGSPIPVLIAVPEYGPWTSLEQAKLIFGGFSNTTAVAVPGSIYPPDCLLKSVAESFFDAPTKPVDTTCLSNPTKRIVLAP
jgi:pimeloyl-ACP methyl ester carboxylesterase